jgi:hypothetical protein
MVRPNVDPTAEISRDGRNFKKRTLFFRPRQRHERFSSQGRARLEPSRRAAAASTII